MTRSTQHGKRARQEGAVERTEASILAYEEKLKSCEDDTEKKYKWLEEKEVLSALGS